MRPSKKNLFLVVLPILYSLISSNQLDAGIIQDPPPSWDYIYDDQNALELFQEIPDELKSIPYAVYPTGKNYDSFRFNWNKRVNVFPHALFYPTKESEVIDILKILKQKKLPFSIRSGGHNSEGGSLSSGYVIDLKNFNTIRVDKDKQEAYVGAGCRLGKVMETLGTSNVVIPVGRCPTVGVSGLSLGGGIGFLSRTFGLTCDSIKSITVILADDQIVEVNEKSHPDLFWALKGAGNGSYGIVIGLTFNVIPMPEVSSYVMEWDWDPNLISKAMEAWFKWLPTLPNSINTRANVHYRNGKPSLTILGVKAGNEDFTEWKSVFKDVPPNRIQITREPYINFAYKLTAVFDRPFGKNKSKYVMTPLKKETIDAAINFLDQLKSKQAPYNCLFEFTALGGKIKEGKNAYFPKDALALWTLENAWDFQIHEEEAIESAREFYKNVMAPLSNYSYPNTVDYDLGDSYLREYYGGNLEKLIDIKNKYDPNNIFNWHQSIPLKAPQELESTQSRNK